MNTKREELVIKLIDAVKTNNLNEVNELSLNKASFGTDQVYGS
jgi:hypothetical protein